MSGEKERREKRERGMGERRQEIGDKREERVPCSNYFVFGISLSAWVVGDVGDDAGDAGDAMQVMQCR
jgi:hypothetical protein